MTERRAQDPPSQRDSEITLLLQDVAVPDHRHGFWDDLARQMEQTDHLSRIGPALGDIEPDADAEPAPELAPAGPRSIAPLAWRLLAAAVVLALVGGVALLRSGPDDGRRVDSGVTTTAEIEGADPEPASTGDPATTSTVRGERSWLFADEIVWIGDEFVTSALGDSYWTSPDGIEWKRREGPSPVLHRSPDCPQELTCAVTPEAPPIPFHFFGESLTKGLDRAGDVVLFEATGGYSIERLPNPEVQQPDLNPALLAVAAQSDPCFAEFARQDPVETAGSPARDQAYLSSWSGGGLYDPVITLTCVQDSDSALFELDLRDHLDDAQLLAVFSGYRELWVESTGSPPTRVDDFPTSSWSDSDVGGELVTSVSPVSSSGDRFWAADEGTLVSSTNGIDWTAHEVPTAGSEIDQVAASPGGHLALWLVDDRLVWNEEGHVIVSHDAGATWSEPVALSTGDLQRIAVGPAGAAISALSYPSLEEPLTTLTFVAGGRSSAVTLPKSDGTITAVAAVGTDRVLVRTFDERMDVYGLDGTLLHRATWAPWRDGGFDLRWGLALAAVALALVALRRRRRDPEAAPELH